MVSEAGMRPPLLVRTSTDFWKRLTLIYALILPFAAIALAQILSTIGEGGHSTETAFMMLGVIAFMLVAPLALVVGRRWWVERFDDRGVTLRNGRHFSWTDFVRAEPRKRGRGFVNNYDLVFRTGTASVYHLMAENRGEVMDVLNALMRGENPYALR